jgi:hypothetical protein
MEVGQITQEAKLAGLQILWDSEEISDVERGHSALLDSRPHQS